MIRAVADTHTMVWYVSADPRLSTLARSTVEAAGRTGDTIAVSSITFAEVVYLSEKGRIDSQTLGRLLALVNNPRSAWMEVSFDQHVAQAMLRVPRAHVPDLPDRIITATALHLGVPLITRDGQIQKSGAVSTIW